MAIMSSIFGTHFAKIKCITVFFLRQKTPNNKFYFQQIQILFLSTLFNMQRLRNRVDLYLQCYYICVWATTHSSLLLFCIIPYFVAKRRNKLYQSLNNGFVTWILDSFLSPSFVFKEFKTKQWKLILCRTLVYYCSICFLPFTILLLGFFIASVCYGIVERCINRVLYPREEKFEYQSLPLLVQERFYQLQTPLTKYNLYKAYFNPALSKEYNDLFIDQLYVVKQDEPCPKFTPYYNINIQANIYPSMDKFHPNLSYRCYQNSKCTCSKELFNRFQVVKNVTVSRIPSKITLLNLPLFNKISPTELVITHSILTSDDLQLISQLNLDFIKLNLLFDGTNFQNKMQQIFDAVVGTPNIRTQYECICDDDDAFEISVYEWLSTNEYVESIKCREEFQVLIFSFTKS